MLAVIGACLMAAGAAAAAQRAAGPVATVAYSHRADAAKGTLTVKGRIPPRLRLLGPATVQLQERRGRAWISRARTRASRSAATRGRFRLTWTTRRTLQRVRVRIVVRVRGRIVGRGRTVRVRVGRRAPQVLPPVAPTPAGAGTRSGESAVPGDAPLPPGVFAPGTNLGPGQSLFSPSGRYRLVQQGDGNLVLYDTTGPAAGYAVWSSGTAGHPGAFSQMQYDGNFVVYDADRRALMASDTPGHPDAVLAVLDSGRVGVFVEQDVLWSVGRSPSRVEPGGSLRSGDSIVSPDGSYRLVMQTDGNLVLYQGPRALWSSVTPGHPGARLEMQGDGNLVVYDGAQAIWNSQTRGSGAWFQLQDDGNAVVYVGTSTALWASSWGRAGSAPTPAPTRTLGPGETLAEGSGLASSDGRFRLVVQYDGNLVVYDGNRALWSSQTGGGGGTRLVMQTDGNLVLYRGALALWSSVTAGNPGASLWMQDDGNAVVYAPGYRPLWSSFAATVSPAAEAAAQWAQARIGQVATTENPNSGWWSGWCETFASLAYGRRWSGYESAYAHYLAVKAAGQIHTAGVPPRGALVFYSVSRWGHVAISTGGGTVVGTQGLGPPQEAALPVVSKSFDSIAGYLGWATPY